MCLPAFYLLSLRSAVRAVYPPLLLLGACLPGSEATEVRDSRPVAQAGDIQATEDAGMDQETIVVRLKPEAARAVRAGRLAGTASPDLEALDRTLGDLGIRLVPQHPGTGDPALETYFTVSGEPPTDRARIAETLDAQPAVDGAFVKPPASAPGSPTPP